jgi:putative heme iron utilization protein
MTLADQTVARSARELYASSHQGILSTLSLELPGYPFGSVITFAPDRSGRPVILISDIAQHTRNIAADARVSLTLTEGGDDVQSTGRVTIVGNACQLPEEDIEDVAARYYRRFPHAADYHKAHDFSFYRIDPVRVRYIGGFGRIHWLGADELCLSNPFDEEVEAGMIAHMNADHVSAMSDYCRLFGIDPQTRTPRMTGIDTEGFDLMLGKRLVRIPFEKPVASAIEVRQAMVALVQRARSEAAATP